MRNENPQIEFAAATVSTDKAAIQRWKEAVGADFPVLHGVTRKTADAYGLRSYPTLRVLDGDGRVVGSDAAALAKLLAGS